MLKEKLRLNFVNQREKLTKEEVLSSSRSISILLDQLPIWHLQCHHVFLSILRKKEVDTSFIISLLRSKQRTIAVPKISDNLQLVHFILSRETRMMENSWGIPEPLTGEQIEPANIDVVYIPLLAFDRKGNRVGYGKGYYDRFLAACRSNVIKVGLSFFEAVDAISDVDEKDIALDFCVTPKQIYSF